MATAAAATSASSPSVSLRASGSTQAMAQEPVTSAPVKLATTPTSSRTKALRFGVPNKSVASAKINLSETLDKASCSSSSSMNRPNCDLVSNATNAVDANALQSVSVCSSAAGPANSLTGSVTCQFRCAESTNANLPRLQPQSHVVQIQNIDEESRVDEFPPHEPPQEEPPATAAASLADEDEEEDDDECHILGNEEDEGDEDEDEDDEDDDEDDDDEDDEEDGNEDEDDEDEEDVDHEVATRSRAVGRHNASYVVADDEDEDDDEDDDGDDGHEGARRTLPDAVKTNPQASAPAVAGGVPNYLPTASSSAAGSAATAALAVPAAPAAVDAAASAEHVETDDYEEEGWMDCVEATDSEEICTCRDYSDEEDEYSEDELPSRDVDLSSCYQDNASMADDDGTSVATPRSSVMGASSRKRRLTDEGTSAAASPTSQSAHGDVDTDTDSASTPGKRRRQHHDSMQTSTPTTANAIGYGGHYTPGSGLRTPRSLLIPTRDNPPPELNQWLLQFQRWTNAERMHATDRLIDVCEPTQVRHMMKVIEPQFQRDFISLLPKELALGVLAFLEPPDLLRAAQTCRSWRFLCDDNLLWKDKCRRIGLVVEPHLSRPRRGRAGNMPPISSPWKAAYMRQTIIEMNWRSRPIREAKTLKGHDDHVITCLQFCGNRIVSGSDDNTLKVWSAITGKVSIDIDGIVWWYSLAWLSLTCRFVCSRSACVLWSATLVAYGRRRWPAMSSSRAAPIAR